MTDLVIATIAFLSLCAFLFILVLFVPRLDLGAVVGLTVLLAAYDLYSTHKPSG